MKWTPDPRGEWRREKMGTLTWTSAATYRFDPEENGSRRDSHRGCTIKAKTLLLAMAATLPGCLRAPGPRPVPVENDPSIVFPRFFEQPAIEVGAGERPYELDGVTLRAIMVAVNDYLPPGGEERPCWKRPEAQRYRVIRQRDIIFVHIEDDPELCGLQYISLDSGVSYALSTDGRILRRIFGGSPEGALIPEPTDAGREKLPPQPSTTPTASAPGDGPSAEPH